MLNRIAWFSFVFAVYCMVSGASYTIHLLTHHTQHQHTSHTTHAHAHHHNCPSHDSESHNHEDSDHEEHSDECPTCEAYHQVMTCQPTAYGSISIEQLYVGTFFLEDLYPYLVTERHITYTRGPPALIS